MKRVLYFGIFDPEFSRNKVYIRGLRENGVKVTLCIDTTPGIRKYWGLFIKHWRVRKQYDYIIVGYPGYTIVPFAKLLSRKPIIFDALCSFFETEIISRDVLHNVPFRKKYAKLIDWLATRFADYVLVETRSQQEYFETVLGVEKGKCVVVYTGADDSVFKSDNTVSKYERFTVLFRGRITNEAGAEIVLRAAKELEDNGIDFLIIGYGWNKEKECFDKVMQELHPKNVRHISCQVPFEELIPLMQRCHVALGQFAKHERLERTIPHKAFEAMAMRLPYITARARGVSEIMEDKKSCAMVDAGDAQGLAEQIKKFETNQRLRLSTEICANEIFLHKFSTHKLVLPLLKILK